MTAIPRAATYFRALLAREEAEGIAPEVVEAERQAVRAAIAQRDVARLREKGVLPQNESATTTRRAD